MTVKVNINIKKYMYAGNELALLMSQCTVTQVCNLSKKLSYYILLNIQCSINK